MILFSYFGAKSKIAHLYPKPKHAHIIEPFAGAANYALRYWEHDVTLVDSYDVVVRIWRYLQACSPQDILRLPTLKRGMRLSELALSEEERLFLGFAAAAGNATPCDTVSAYADFAARRNPHFYRNIADTLHKIRHWRVVHGSYTSLPNTQATWFVDAPYEQGGYKYKHHTLDYAYLAQWCKERAGQVIVCENTKAQWLPFAPLAPIQGANKASIEAVWLNTPMCSQGRQATLFE